MSHLCTLPVVAVVASVVVAASVALAFAEPVVAAAVAAVVDLDPFWQLFALTGNPKKSLQTQHHFTAHLQDKTTILRLKPRNKLLLHSKKPFSRKFTSKLVEIRA